MACDSCKSCMTTFAKVILIIINTVVLIVSFALIILGSLTLTKGAQFETGISLVPVGIALIVLGVFMLFIGCFGCFGAITGKHSLLNVYLVVMGIVVVLEIAILIFGLVSKGTVDTEIEKALTDPFANVNINGTDASEEDQETVNNIQTHITCCGLTGPDYWKATTFGVGKVPKSCCPEDDQPAVNATAGNATCAASNAYPDGCLTKANDLVAQALTILIIAIVVIILFQVICMILACCSKGEYEEVSTA